MNTHRMSPVGHLIELGNGLIFVVKGREEREKKKRKKRREMKQSSSDTFRLQQRRWGYLSPVVQLFKTDLSNSYIQ